MDCQVSWVNKINGVPSAATTRHVLPTALPSCLEIPHLKLLLFSVHFLNTGRISIWNQLANLLQSFPPNKHVDYTLIPYKSFPKNVTFLWWKFLRKKVTKNMERIKGALVTWSQSPFSLPQSNYYLDFLFKPDQQHSTITSNYFSFSLEIYSHLILM